MHQLSTKPLSPSYIPSLDPNFYSIVVVGGRNPASPYSGKKISDVEVRLDTRPCFPQVRAKPARATHIALGWSCLKQF